MVKIKPYLTTNDYKDGISFSQLLTDFKKSLVLHDNNTGSSSDWQDMKSISIYYGDLADENCNLKVEHDKDLMFVEKELLKNKDKTINIYQAVFSVPMAFKKLEMPHWVVEIY